MAQIWASTTCAPRPCTRLRKGQGRARVPASLPQKEDAEGLLGWASARADFHQGFRVQEHKRFIISRETTVRGEKSHPQLGLWLNGALEIVSNHQIHCKSTEAKLQTLHFGAGPGNERDPQKVYKDLANRCSDGERVWISLTFSFM